jgi:hypothetical protein
MSIEIFFRNNKFAPIELFLLRRDDASPKRIFSSDGHAILSFGQGNQALFQSTQQKPRCSQAARLFCQNE